MADEKLMAGAEASDAPVAEPVASADNHASRTDSTLDILTGSFYHSLDSKGRIIVPAQFRETLGEKFFAGPNDHFTGIALYPTAVWLRMRERLARLSAMDSLLRRYLAQFDAMSYRDQECDNQGRLLLPARLRQRLLGEDKELEVSGAYDHVLIMTRPKSEDEYLDVLAHMPDVHSRLDALNINYPVL